MNNEQKRYIWLIIGSSFWAGIGVMSIANIIKIVFNHYALTYDWIMLAISIVFITICLIDIKKKKGTFQ
jgi:hypothetical protein